MQTIFLSYRRDDTPGYVSRLESDLERAFGRDRVFRDVQDIAGGTKWREELRQGLASAGALVVVIGPRWEQIWDSRRDAQNSGNDYVLYELAYAREHEIPIVPVTLGGGRLSPDIDLGEVAWLAEYQMYDICDVQGRWETDVQGLTEALIDQHGILPTGIGSVPLRPPPSSWRKFVIAAAVVAGLALLTQLLAPHLGMSQSPEPLLVGGPDQPTESSASSLGEADQPLDSPAPSLGKPAYQPPPVRVDTPASAAGCKVNTYNNAAIADVSGVWRWRDTGTDYSLTQHDDCTLTVSTAGARGNGAYVANMPGKFRFSLSNGVQGEFSAHESRMLGALVVEGRKQHGELRRVP